MSKFCRKSSNLNIEYSLGTAAIDNNFKDYLSICSMLGSALSCTSVSEEIAASHDI